MRRAFDFFGSPWGYMLFIAGVVAVGALLSQARPPASLVRFGVYELHIEPVDSERQSSARYRLVKNGKEVWEGEKPYTLRDVAITDAGWAVGYAYRTGAPVAKECCSVFPNADAKDPPEYLHIVILDSSGVEVLNEVNERIDPYFGYACRMGGYQEPRPYIRHFVVDDENDRLIVHVDPSRAKGPAWWFYRISTGALQDRINPRRAKKGERHFDVMDVLAIPGTSYLLMHWLSDARVDRDLSAVARFTVGFANLDSCWELELQNNYAALDIDGPLDWDDPRNFFRETPAIRLEEEPGRFSIRDFAKDEVVHFSVGKDEKGCPMVTELSRKRVVGDGS